jgi:hypothetical protein
VKFQNDFIAATTALRVVATKKTAIATITISVTAILNHDYP